MCAPETKSERQTDRDPIMYTMFHLRAYVTLALAVCCVANESAGPKLEWTSEEGMLMVNGKQVHLKGASWFGFETTRRSPHGLWGNANSSFFLDFLASNDFNAIRMPLDLDLMLHDAPHQRVADDPSNKMTALQYLDFLVDECATRGIVMLLDMHCLDTGGTNESPLWFNSKFTEQDALNGWTAMAKRFKDKWNVFAIDVFNEPFGGTWAEGKPTDMDAFAVKAAAAVHAETDWLIFVEGTWKSPNCTKTFDNISVACGYGDNLIGVAEHPVELGKPKKLVYSSHTYGPSQHDRPEFKDPAFPDNMPAIWQDHWGYVANKTGSAVVLGEFGGTTAGATGQWYAALINYLTSAGHQDTFFWCLNSDSTTGGLLVDWKTPDTAKLALLKKLQPNPTDFKALVPPSPAPAPASPTPAPGPTPAPPPTPKPAGCAKAYGACGGGPHYDGPTCCQGSCTCAAKQPSYSQCVPPAGKEKC
jgi:endoglucanase